MNYNITSINDADGWIFISGDNSFEEPDAFVALVKEISTSVNGKIIPVGHTQYRISNIPYDLLFQWDDLFGIVVINGNVTETEDVLRFLKLYGIS